MLPRSPPESSSDIGTHTRDFIIEDCSACGGSSITRLIGWCVWTGEFLCSQCLVDHIGHESYGRWRLAPLEFRHYSTLQWTTERPPPPPEPIRPPREYWYWLTWTYNDDHTIGDVWENILKFSRCRHHFLALDVVLEHGEKSGRLHYHMRVRTSRCLKRQRIQRYQTAGKIKFDVVRSRTQENWNRLENYMTKENPIINLLLEP